MRGASIGLVFPMNLRANGSPEFGKLVYFAAICVVTAASSASSLVRRANTTQTNILTQRREGAKVGDQVVKHSQQLLHGRKQGNGESLYPRFLRGLLLNTGFVLCAFA
jgi:hypothetical protein